MPPASRDVVTWLLWHRRRKRRMRPADECKVAELVTVPVEDGQMHRGE